MKTLPKAITPIYAKRTFGAEEAHAPNGSERKVVTFRNPKTGETHESFKNAWNADSAIGSSEIRNGGDGLLLHDEIVALFGSETDLN